MTEYTYELFCYDLTNKLYCTTRLTGDHLVDHEEAFFEAFYDVLYEDGSADIIPLSMVRVESTKEISNGYDEED